MNGFSSLIFFCFFFGLIFTFNIQTIEAKKTTKTSTKSTKKETSVKDDSAEKRLSIIAEKHQFFDVIPLSNSNFTRFIVDRPRNYQAILMFTALDPKFGCEVCNHVASTFREVAKEYNSQYNLTTIADKERVVFFILDFEYARDIFAELQLQTVPRFYKVPLADATSKRIKIQDYEMDSKNLMQGLKPAVEHINQETGIEIKILVDPWPYLLVICIFAALLGLLVSAASDDVWSAFFWYQTPKIWVVVSLICFGVGVSGSIYCIIRSSPPLGYNRQGVLSLFAAQGREQYLIEGIIVSLWTIGCGLSLYLLNLSTKIRFPLIKHILSVLFMTLFLIFGIQLWGAYCSKTLWYSLKDTLPPEVWSFISSSVKKNSGLFKRILRLGEYWLFESKDLEGFKKKFEALFVEYVKRTYLNK